MTYVSDDVKHPVTQDSGILSRMTTFRRLAGLRFTYLIKQLQEEDPDKWSIQAIADAIGCHRSLVSKWHPDNVRERREPPDRSGLTDLVIQGIHDGLGVGSEFLFMSSKGLPKHVILRNGAQRPCGEDEVDHKLFRLDEERLKVEVKRQAALSAEQAKEMAAMREEMSEMRALLRQLAGADRTGSSIR